MRTHHFRSLLSFLLAAVCAPAAHGQIQWTASLDAALEKAKAEKRVIFVAMNMDRERANDEMVAVHYKDPILVRLSRNTINLFCSNNLHKKSGSCTRCKGTTCTEHRKNDFDVRRQILGVDGDAALVAPQHLFVSPEGKIIHSAAYFITKGELEWMWVDAIREIQPTFDWAPSGRIRAPERLKKGTADKTVQSQKPPTKKEVQQALKDIKKRSPSGGGRRGWRDMIQNALKNSRIVIRSDDKKAFDWGKVTLRAYGRYRGTLIRDIGNVSPKPWARVIEEWLEDRNKDTRRTTVVAIEKLANPKSVSILKRLAKKEKETAIQGRFLRALAVCGPTNRGAINAVSKAVKTHKSPLVRAHAVVGAGKLEDRAAVTDCLRAALQDEDAIVRSVAAYVIAIRQDKDLLEYLQSSLQAETDAAVAKWFRKAKKAIESSDPKEFKDFLRNVLDDEAGGEDWQRRLRERERADDDGKKKSV